MTRAIAEPCTCRRHFSPGIVTISLLARAESSCALRVAVRLAVKTNQPVEISTDVCFPERQIMHIRSHGQHCMRGAFRMSSGIPPTTLKTVRQYNPALSARQRSNQLTPELRPSASDGAHTHSSPMHFRSHGQRCMRGAFRVVSGIAPTASETARPHQPALSARQRSNQLLSELRQPVSDSAQTQQQSDAFSLARAALHAWRISSGFWHRIRSF